MEKIDFVQITRRDSVSEDEFYPAIFAMFDEIRMRQLPMQFLTKGLAVRRKHNVITPPDTPIPDCVTCGVCCEAMLCVGVRPGEEERLTPDDYWDVTVEGVDAEIVVDRYLRRDGETLRCKFLNISEDYQTTCGIYERRPQMCHDFDAGSDKCHALRRAYGLDPFLTVDEMLAAKNALENAPARRDPSAVIGSAKFAPKESGKIMITAHLLDQTSRIIHEFSPEHENYLQFEFDALTLDEAADLIASRTANGDKAI